MHPTAKVDEHDRLSRKGKKCLDIFIGIPPFSGKRKGTSRRHVQYQRSIKNETIENKKMLE
jgi:hypothetical protein